MNKNRVAWTKVWRVLLWIVIVLIVQIGWSETAIAAMDVGDLQAGRHDGGEHRGIELDEILNRLAGLLLAVVWPWRSAKSLDHGNPEPESNGDPRMIDDEVWGQR